MDDPRLIQPADAAVVRVLQITDSHIFADPQARMQGLDTRRSLAAVCDAVAQQQGEFDALLATGDLSQDASAESYRHLARQLACFARPVFWIPGNHDDAKVMTVELDAAFFDDAKHVLLADWQIVLLDSTLPGVVHGRVSSAQLDFLDAALERCPDKHALICLHHQAVDSGSQWIDDKGLRDSHLLRARISAHDQVRGVLWGHVHQETRQRFDGIEWMSTPSTCVQFKPLAEEFALDDLAPGFRRLALHADGRIETEVHRLDADQLDFVPIQDPGEG